MVTRPIFGVTHVVGICILTLMVTISCKKLPDPSFIYMPTENPEAGDTIFFTNETKNGSSYSWDFGDGGSSTDENPDYIYTDAGIYNVRLTAINNEGEESIVQPVTINEPTILGFLVTDSVGERVFAGAEIWVYDNQVDWENLDEPLLQSTTNEEGFSYFVNVIPKEYHIWAFKNESGGVWLFGGYTPMIDQNEINLFNVPCEWIPDEEEASVSIKSYQQSTGTGFSRELFPAR